MNPATGGHSARLLLIGLLLLTLLAVRTSQAGAVRNLAGFTSHTLAANDDGSTGTVPIGFTVNFYGTNFVSCFVNNNGNITFDHSLATFTPFGLTGTVAQIIAPFFADVDTRGIGSALVTYGNDTVSGRPAFGVDWINVGYFASHVDRINSFQLVLIDRSDIAAGDFDIEFNYDQVQWETGDASGGVGGLGGNSARVGYSNGSTQPGTFFELPGSAVNGAFLDADLTNGLIHRALNSSVPGRSVFFVRSGVVLPIGLVVGAAVTPAEVPIDSNVTFTVTVNNAGASTASNVVVTGEFPPGLAPLSSTATQGGCDINSNVVTCDLGDLPAGATAFTSVLATPTVVGDLCVPITVSTNGSAASSLVCLSVRPPFTGQCITRTAQFWFTHPDGPTTNCATLLEAIVANSQHLDLGFIVLPAAFENSDPVKDAVDAVIEALGFYWRGAGTTGDGAVASKVCRARKRLAGELIAAIANMRFLNTNPADCSYFNGTSMTNFPPDLVEQAKTAAAGEDATAMATMQVLLAKFNQSGLTNNFVGDLVECSPFSRKNAKSIARDPTDKLHCPGLNDTCFTAVPVIFPRPRNAVSFPKFSDSLDTRQVSSTGEAWWKLEPPIAADGRQFTLDTSKSNFQTQLDVLTGSCLLAGSNGVTVVTNSLTSIFGIPSSNAVPPETVSFATDGSRTYFIKVTGGVGKINLRITSP